MSKIGVAKTTPKSEPPPFGLGVGSATPDLPAEPTPKGKKKTKKGVRVWPLGVTELNPLPSQTGVVEPLPWLLGFCSLTTPKPALSHPHVFLFIIIFFLNFFFIENMTRVL
jgi:hypothetical protein